MSRNPWRFKELIVRYEEFAFGSVRVVVATNDMAPNWPQIVGGKLRDKVTELWRTPQFSLHSLTTQLVELLDPEEVEVLDRFGNGLKFVANPE